MKKYAVLWFAAIALVLSAGAGSAAAHNPGGMHGHLAQRQGFEQHRFERRHELGRFEQRRFEQRHELGRFNHFRRHSRVIIIGGFGPPIYYAPPYVEQYPPIYIVPGVGYSYYCTDPSGYYPEIQDCPSGWLQVIPETSSY